MVSLLGFAGLFRSQLYHGESLRLGYSGTEMSHWTTIIPRILRNFSSLMPCTIITCSGRRKGPYCERCATIRSAITLPTPGSFSSSCAVAALMFMRRLFSVLTTSRLACASDRVRWGSVAQPELQKASATSKTTRCVESFAGGRLCFTYASDRL